MSTLVQLPTLRRRGLGLDSGENDAGIRLKLSRRERSKAVVGEDGEEFELIEVGDGCWEMASQGPAENGRLPATLLRIPLLRQVFADALKAP